MQGNKGQFHCGKQKAVQNNYSSSLHDSAVNTLHCQRVNPEYWSHWYSYITKVGQENGKCGDGGMGIERTLNPLKLGSQ